MAQSAADTPRDTTKVKAAEIRGAKQTRPRKPAAQTDSLTSAFLADRSGLKDAVRAAAAGAGCVGHILLGTTGGQSDP